MADEWVPSEEGLRELLQILERTLHGDTVEGARKQLDEFNLQVPDYNNYLVHILCYLDDISFRLRMQAGIQLKANLVKYFDQVDPASMEHIFVTLVNHLHEREKPVRNTMCNVLSGLVRRGSLKSFPGLVDHLVRTLQDDDEYAVMGAATTIAQLCQDVGSQLVKEEHGKPANDIIPALIDRLDHPSSFVREQCLRGINFFIPAMPIGLSSRMGSLMEAVIILCEDPETIVRRRVCNTFCALLDWPQYMQDVFESVLEFIYECCLSEDSELALEGLEFWANIAESCICIEALENRLTRVFTVLLTRMVYSEDVIALCEQEEGDSADPDKPNEVNPAFFLSEGRVFGSANEEDDISADYDDPQEWNCRKCAAFSLDLLSSQNAFGPAILTDILPLISERIASENHWAIRESALLALGAIAEGTLTEDAENDISQYLPDIIPVVLENLKDASSLVRSSACWVLSRYMTWIVLSNEPVEMFFEPVMRGLLRSMQDHRKGVQRAACSAFANFEEEAGRELCPYLEEILGVFSLCFQHFQESNLYVLYDAVGALVEAVKERLVEDGHFDVLMTPLQAKWGDLSDSDKGLIPLLECMTSVVSVLGQNLEQHMASIFERCCSIIESTLFNRGTADEMDVEKLDHNFIVCSMDLISGMMDSLGAQVGDLISQSKILELAFVAAKDELANIRQCAHAFFGQCANFAYSQIRENVFSILEVLLADMFPYSLSISACNNAVWALGCIVQKLGEDEHPTLSDSDVQSLYSNVLPKLKDIFSSQSNYKPNMSLLQTTALTLGRLSTARPDLVAPHLPDFAEEWCIHLRLCQDNDDKYHAFVGLCTVVEFSPNSMQECFPHLCAAFASWKPNHLAPELKERFVSILEGYKGLMGGQAAWDQYLSHPDFPEDMVTVLREEFGV